MSLIPQIIEAVWIFARIRRAPAKSLLLECQIQALKARRLLTPRVEQIYTRKISS